MAHVERRSAVDRRDATDLARAMAPVAESWRSMVDDLRGRPSLLDSTSEARAMGVLALVESMMGGLAPNQLRGHAEVMRTLADMCERLAVERDALNGTAA
jgi:hypothetical protein